MTINEPREDERDVLTALLYLLRYDLHPVYGNTSHRGRGVGGQTMTPSCSVNHPEGSELALLNAVDNAISKYFEVGDDERRRRIARVIEALRADAQRSWRLAVD